MGVIVPAVAAALAALFQLAPAVEIALLAMAVGPVPPILPGKLLRLGGRASYVYGLLVAASLAAIVVVPLAIEVLGWLFRREAHVGAGVVARVVGVTVLLPLATGLAVRYVAPRVAEGVALWASRLGAALLARRPPGCPDCHGSGHGVPRRQRDGPRHRRGGGGGADGGLRTLPRRPPAVLAAPDGAALRFPRRPRGRPG